MAKPSYILTLACYLDFVRAHPAAGNDLDIFVLSFCFTRRYVAHDLYKHNRFEVFVKALFGH